MTVKELAQVFGYGVIIYISYDGINTLDKKVAGHIDKSNYCDKEVLSVRVLTTGGLLVFIKE